MPSPIPLAEALSRVLPQLAVRPGFERWWEQVKSTGGCANPIHLMGSTATVDVATGEVLHSYDTRDEPRSRLLVACGNRRASRCPSCSETYRADTFQLVRAGLTGGKGVPDTVREHPRVFTTFTAPSFGAVHNQPTRNGKAVPCRCGARHADDDPALGTPVDPAAYDYLGAVLWNAHAGALWARFTILLRRELAKAAGLTRKAFEEQARVSYGKVAEYQRRGLVHFHAVIRIDGPDGPDNSPPAWASTDLLDTAIHAASRAVRLVTPASQVVRQREIVWGEQLDICPVKAFGDGEELTDTAVAGYIAKYATKGATDGTDTVDRPIYCRTCRGAGTVAGEVLCAGCGGHGLAEPIECLKISEHAKNMIRTCSYLAELEEFAELKLRRWAHMLGFRGHFSTKSRRYSTTLGALRDARTEFRAAQQWERLGLIELEAGSVLVLTHWRYAGNGHEPGESLVVETIARGLVEGRRLAREEMAAASGL